MSPLEILAVVMMYLCVPLLIYFIWRIESSRYNRRLRAFLEWERNEMNAHPLKRLTFGSE